MNEIKRGLQRLQEDGILSEGDANEVLCLILSRYVSNWGPNGSSDISGLLALRDDQPSASTVPVAPFSPVTSVPPASSAGFAGPPPSHATAAPGPTPSRFSCSPANAQEDLLGLYAEEAESPAPHLPSPIPAHSFMSELAGNPQDVLARSRADTAPRDNPDGQFMVRDKHGNDYFDYDAFQASQAEQIGLVPKNKSKPSLPVVNYDSKQFADFSSSASSAPSSQPSSSRSSQIVAPQDRSVIGQVSEQDRAKEQEHLTRLERATQDSVLMAHSQVLGKYKGQSRSPPSERDRRSPISAAAGPARKLLPPPAKGSKPKSRPSKKKTQKAGSGSQQDESRSTRTNLGNASDTAGVAGNLGGEMPPPGSRPSDPTGEEEPLECYFWHEVGLCRKRHFCTYAHHPTGHGRVAPRPHSTKGRRNFRDSPNPGLRSDNWRQVDTPPISTPAATSVGTPTETPQPFDDQLGDQSVEKKLDELSLDAEN